MHVLNTMYSLLGVQTLSDVVVSPHTKKIKVGIVIDRMPPRKVANPTGCCRAFKLVLKEKMERFKAIVVGIVE